jgi:hypothetical protein
MNTTRRRFLQTVAGAASLGLPNLPLLGKLAAFGAEPPPDTMRFGPDIEPIVRSSKKRRGTDASPSSSTSYGEAFPTGGS